MDIKQIQYFLENNQEKFGLEGKHIEVVQEYLDELENQYGDELDPAVYETLEGVEHDFNLYLKYRNPTYDTKITPLCFTQECSHLPLGERERNDAAAAAALLLRGFGWYHTNDGSEFWTDVHDRLMRIVREGR